MFVRGNIFTSAVLRERCCLQELAGTAHYDTMRELLATTEAKVLLAIDEYNELFQISHWHYGDNKVSKAGGRWSGESVPVALRRGRVTYVTYVFNWGFEGLLFCSNDLFLFWLCVCFHPDLYSFWWCQLFALSSL